MRELLKAGLLAATLLALLPAAALAAPQWLGSEPLDTGFVSSGSGPDVTTDSDGNSAAVWIGSGGEVNAAVRPRGGPWGASQNLEPGGQVQTEDAPRVIAEPDGEFVAVWVGDLGGTSGNYIRWAHKPPAQDWSTPAPIDQTLTNTALLALETGAGGDTTVLWTDLPGNTSTSTKPAGSDTWDASDALPNTGDPAKLALTVSADGASEVVYPATCNDVSFLDCVLARYRPPGGDWGIDEVAGVANTEVTGVAVNSRAAPVRYTVVWGEDQTTGPQTPPGRVASADRSSGAAGTWDATSTTVADLLTAAPGCPTSTSFGCIDLASRDDTLAAVWQQGDDGSGESIAGSLRTGDGAWGAREAVGDVGNGDAFPQAALTASETAVAAWGDGPSGSAVARASHRATNGAWTQKAIGTAAEGAAVLPDVVADGLGDAVTAWREPGGVQAAGFDGAGPRFSAFALPSGSVGQALPFSAAADDNWSALASIDWLFGDGTGAPGASVSHAYGVAGSYTATATAKDTLDNATQRSGTLGVGAAATPVPTPTPDPCGTGDKDKDGIKDGCDTNDGSARPVAFKTVNATVVSGDVFVKLPAGAARASQAKPPKGFVRLEGAQTIPVGSTLDTAKGRVSLRTASDTRKHVQTAQFFRGRFLIRQVRKPRGKAKKRSTKLITELRLTGSSFSKACKARASISAKRRSKKRVRRLFGDGKGSFRTRGRNAAATVRGTRWSVQDRCDGTLVTVQRGRVEVRDLVRHKTVFVRTGHTYLAPRR